MARSCQWYLKLLGRPEELPAHDYWGQIRDSEGKVLLCLHEWEEHGHPTITAPNKAQPGNGLILFFLVDDFDQALERARGLGSDFAEEPHVNPRTGTREFALRDPDGYYVMINEIFSGVR